MLVQQCFSQIFLYSSYMTCSCTSNCSHQLAVPLQHCRSWDTHSQQYCSFSPSSCLIQNTPTAWNHSFYAQLCCFSTYSYSTCPQLGRAVLPVCRALNCCEQTWCMYIIIIIVTIKYNNNIHNIQLWLFVVKILNRNLNLKRVEITYILSDMARRLPSTLGFCDITTLNNPSHLCLFWLFYFKQEISKFILPGTFSCPLGCRHFSGSFGCISGRISGKT